MDQVSNTAGSSDDDVDARFQLALIVTNIGTSDAGMDLDLQVIAQSADDDLDLLGQLASGGHDEGLDLVLGVVDTLEDGDGESGGLTGTRLGLGNHITSRGAWNDGTLLNGGRLFETKRVDTTNEFFLQVHVVKLFVDLITVGLDNGIVTQRRRSYILTEKKRNIDKEIDNQI